MIVRRWVITHVADAPPRLRRLTFAQQGRHTYETAEHAQADLDLFKGPQGLPRVLSSAEVDSLAVREVDCWAGHHDPVGYYADETEVHS